MTRRHRTTCRARNVAFLFVLQTLRMRLSLARRWDAFPQNWLRACTWAQAAALLRVPASYRRNDRCNMRDCPCTRRRRRRSAVTHVPLLQTRPPCIRRLSRRGAIAVHIADAAGAVRPTSRRFLGEPRRGSRRRHWRRPTARSPRRRRCPAPARRRRHVVAEGRIQLGIVGAPRSSAVPASASGTARQHRNPGSIAGSLRKIRQSVDAAGIRSVRGSWSVCAPASVTPSRVHRRKGDRRIGTPRASASNERMTAPTRRPADLMMSPRSPSLGFRAKPRTLRG